MNSINANTSNNYVVSSGINQEKLKANLADSRKAVNQNIENHSVTKLVTGSGNGDNSKMEAVFLLPVLKVCDNFVNKLMGGSEDKNLLKKIANIGDAISNKLHLDKIFSGEKIGRINNFIKNNRFTKYFTNDYAAIPRSAMAKRSTLAQEVNSKLDAQAMKVVSSLAQDANLPELAATNPSLSEATIKFVKSLGNEGKQFQTTEILSALDDMAANGIKINADTSKLNQLRNKLKAASSQMGDTVLGQKLAKGVLKTKNIATYGGDLLSLYFAATALVQAAKAAKEAPKGEKKSTFMHVLSEQYLGFILIGPSTNLVYKLGGNKYRGMTAEGREALKKLIEETNKSKNLTKEGLKIAKMKRSLLVKGVDKNKVEKLTGKGLKEAKKLAKSLKKEGAKLKWWEKPLKAMGKILSTGLDKLQKPTFIKGVRIPKPTLKGFVGGFGRFILIMMVIQPLIQKPLTKLCHKIFGKPTAYLKKQEAENASGQQKTESSNNLNKGETNLLNLYSKQINNPQQNQTVPNMQQPQLQVNPQAASTGLVSPQEQSEIPAFNLFKQKEERYIPSLDPAPSQSNEEELNARVKKIKQENDRIIKNAQKYFN